MIEQSQLTAKNTNQNLLSNLNLISSELLPLSTFSETESLADTNSQQRMAAALNVLLDLIIADDSHVENVDPGMLDYFIGRLDHMLNLQLDEILHHAQFQALESSWRSLNYLVSQTSYQENIKIELLDIDKENLRLDFNNAMDTTQTALYKHLYVDEYDTPGGQPISAMISDYEFNSSHQDITLLQGIANVAAVTHAPFIAALGSEFFHKETLDEVAKIEDLKEYMERAEYIRWNAFRETDAARYIGLTFPRFLLRLPYGEQNPIRQFCYNENVIADDANKYLWGNASFTFASNLVRSFQSHGWTVNIRGPEAGGKIDNLLLHQYQVGRGWISKIPTEILIPETRELELAELGFIPLSYYKNSDFACFFSANSTQKATQYLDSSATANSRINARLPYIFLTSRLAHYLKVLQREKIGTNKNCIALKNELNTWLQTLVTRMNNPEPEIIASHPLKEAYVEVNEIEDNPGFFSVSLCIVPHFQIEGMDIRLSLVSQMPTTSNKN